MGSSYNGLGCIKNIKITAKKFGHDQRPLTTIFCVFLLNVNSSSVVVFMTILFLFLYWTSFLVTSPSVV